VGDRVKLGELVVMVDFVYPIGSSPIRLDAVITAL